jgi:hypothetical protein
LREGESLFPSTRFFPVQALEGRPAPAHHPERAKPPACAACHPEHRGKPTLTRVADGSCTACHAHLDGVVEDNSPFQNVTSFVDDHPEFRALKEPDPGRLRFAHAAHLKDTGLVMAEGPRVRLVCQDCHQVTNDGHFMKPVHYEQHCARCHPLSVVVASHNPAPPLQEAINRFAQTPAPHREPSVVRQALRDRYAQFVSNHPAILNNLVAPEPLLPLPGKRPVATRGSDSAAWARLQTSLAERMLFQAPGGCRRCHLPIPQTDTVQARAELLPEFVPTTLPPRWLRHAGFNHAADGHRDCGCSHCHKAASSHSSRNVLLPSIDTCRKCHAPRKSAPFDCASCHTYHVPQAWNQAGRRNGQAAWSPE